MADSGRGPKTVENAASALVSVVCFHFWFPSGRAGQEETKPKEEVEGEEGRVCGFEGAFHVCIQG